MYDEILVPTDGSAGVEQALDHAVALASKFDARIHTIYVLQTPEMADTLEGDELGDILDRLDEAGRQAVEDVRRQARNAGLSDIETAVRRGVPEAEIRAYIDEQEIDLVVMATEGRTGSAREMLGSVTEEVVRSTSAPVLTVNVGEES
ncbi:universal stress protein [Halovenus sp. WSH3]|uniref:Universal stress protein n=1 Tax=Halovenus carboxidivorans TaxID=2692199 RepID=A0A6B0T9B1_9EURY|nr:universal stress protein [Halovenus carboxidivorans]MXR51831.1 universal stress protein [Halovenus carboxidivorans]